MMAIVAEGYDSCPMEGFDEQRIKKILKLNWQSHIVMIVGVGKEEKGVYGPQFRVPFEMVYKYI